MTNEIKDKCYADCFYKRGSACDSKNYETWLDRLGDAEFLDTYTRVTNYIFEMNINKKLEDPQFYEEH